MSDYPASSLYLASLSSHQKKRSTRQLKSVQDELTKLVSELSPTTLIHREGSRDVPFAWDALMGEFVYEQVQIVYFHSEGNTGADLFLSQKSPKRQPLDLEAFGWKAFPDMSLLVLDGNYPFELAEKLLFSDAPAVLVMPQTDNKKGFRQVLFTELLKGEKLSFALNTACNEMGIQMPLYTIPSDPYAYWSWKESRENEDLTAGCLINLSGKERIINWSWTPYGYHADEAQDTNWQAEPEKNYFEETVEAEEPKAWYEADSEFSTWYTGQLMSSYQEGREREFRHIAAKTGDINPNPNAGSPKRLEIEQQSYSYSHPPEVHGGYELIPTSSIEEREVIEEAYQPSHEYGYKNEGEKQEDVSPPTGSTNPWLSWPVLTWIGLTCALLTLSSIAYVMPGRQTPKLNNFKFLSHVSSAEDYKVLLLPFDPILAEDGGSSWAEKTVRDWVNTLPESQEMGIEVIYANGSALPANTEEAKRIGEIYNANLVIWGDYSQFSRDTSLHHLKYVSPHSDYMKTSHSEAVSGAAAFNDVYDLQEGFLTGGIEDINYWILATAYMKRGDYRSAYSNLQLVTESNGRGMAVVHQMIAKCYFGLEYFSDCIEAYTTAIDHDPANANAFYQRANVYHLIKKNEEAIADYEMALKLNPNHLEAKAKLEEVIEEGKNIEVTLPEVDQSSKTSFTLAKEEKDFANNGGGK